MLKFLPIAILAALAMTCSSLPPEVPIPEDNKDSGGKTEDGHDVVVYQEGYLDNILTKVDTATTAEGFSKTLLFKDMKAEDIPNVGDIISSAITENAPYGFLYKVLGVSTKDGITTIAVRDAALEEAVENVNFESETELEFDEDGNLLRMLQKTTSSNMNLAKEIPLGNNKKITVDVSYTVTLDFNVEIKKWKLQSMKMAIRQNGKTTLNGSIKEKIEKTIQKEIGKINLPPITLWIFVPVVFTNDLSFYLKIAGNAETDLNATYTINTSGEYGFEYRDGTFKKILTNNISENSFDYEQNVSGEVRIGVIASLGTKLYGAIGLALDAGPALKLSVEGQTAGVYVYEDGFKDSEKNGAYLDFGLDFAAKITLGMLGFNLKSYTFAESWTTLKPLYKTSFLPLFDSLQVNISDSGITIKSGIKRDKLNYPVKTFGICIEKNIGDCKNKKGERKILGENVKSSEYREINTTINNIEYEDYYIMPYFENGVGGTYYDKYVHIADGEIQSSSSNSSSCETETYKTVVIGTQTWMADNLNCDIKGSVCYSNSKANCSKYGRLYDWATAMALDSSCNSTACSDQVQPKHKGICPVGWHIPSEEEWNILTDYAGGSSEAGKYLKAASGWNNNGNGLDSYEFAALPGGLGYSAELFQTVGNGGYWWTSSENNASYAFYRGIYYDNENVGRLYDKKSNLLSVRCVKD